MIHTHKHQNCPNSCPKGGSHCKHTCMDCGEQYCCKCGKVFNYGYKQDWNNNFPNYNPFPNYICNSPATILCSNNHSH